MTPAENLELDPISWGGGGSNEKKKSMIRTYSKLFSVDSENGTGDHSGRRSKCAEVKNTGIHWNNEPPCHRTGGNSEVKRRKS